MFPIYQITFKKLAKKISTWLIIAIAVFLAFFVFGFLFFKTFVDYKTITSQSYIAASKIVYSSIALLFAFFSAIFTSFIGARLFKDEIEDGTFLITLSKPISRGRILFEKFLAYITYLLIFVFLVMTSIIIAIAIFDKPDKSNPDYNQLKNELMSAHKATIYFTLLPIGFLISLILGSITIMVSTKASVGATIGITSSIGVLIPITGMMGNFTNKSSHYHSFLQSSNKSIDGTKAFLSQYNIKKGNIRQTSKQIKFNLGTERYSISLGKDPAQSLAKIYDIGFQYYFYNFSKQDGHGIINLGIDNNKKDFYTGLSFFDINYQVSKLGNLAESAINKDPKVVNHIDYSSVVKTTERPNLPKKEKVDFAYKSSQITSELKWLQTQTQNFLQKNIISHLKIKIPPEKLPKIFSIQSFIQLDQLNIIAAQSFNEKEIKQYSEATKKGDENDKIIASLNFFAQRNKLVSMKATSYLNAYAILGVYLFIGIILMPSAYLIIKRSDFK